MKCESKIQFYRTLAQAFGLGTLAWMLSACGAQQFQALATTENQQAAGSLKVAAKVDVVLVEENKGRILDNYAMINQSAQSFLSTLAQKGWNYHFIALPTDGVGSANTTLSPILQATSSQQDPNWGSQWTPTFPGECGNDPTSPACGFPTNEDTLNPSIFQTLSNYSGFLQQSQVINTSYEPGFYNMLQSFTSIVSSNTNFFRPDALLAVVVLSIGDDTSYMNYCFNGSYYAPCETVTNTQCTGLYQSAPQGQELPPGSAQCGSSQLGLNFFLSQLQSVKSSAQQVKFYAATSHINTATSGGQNCLGGSATPGTRYQSMASSLGGKNYDVCSQPLSSILTDVAQNLTSTALAFVTGYIRLNEQPNPATIQVIKYPGGNAGNPVTLSNDPNNGWTYVGLQNSIATIIEPSAMNYESGYMIQLNGSAQLSGADTASVTYKTPSGAQGN